MASNPSLDTQRAVDASRIEDLVQTERLARDLLQWERMHSCFSNDAHVEMSWFKGSGFEFVEAAKRMSASGAPAFHQMTPTVTRVNGSRALAESGCAIHLRAHVAGAEADVVSHARYLTRVERCGDAWLICGLRAFYLRDMLVAADPTNPPRLSASKLNGYRPSYRYLSYLLEEQGHPVSNDLPGIDLPDSVAALVANEERWLSDGATR